MNRVWHRFFVRAVVALVGTMLGVWWFWLPGYGAEQGGLESFVYGAEQGGLEGFGYGAEREGTGRLRYGTQQEKQGGEEGLLSAEIPDLGLEDIQVFLDRQYGQENISFSGVMEDMVKGRFREAGETIFHTFWESFLEEMEGSIGFLGQAAALGLLGAVFAQAAAVFPGSRIAEIGFFITYLLTFTCLTASFFTSVETAGGVVENVLDFMKVLLPSFFLAVAFSGGSISSAALYGTVVGGVSGAQFLCGRVLLPLVKVYVLLVLAGNISREVFVRRLTEGLEKGVRWSLKTMVGVFLGLQMVQTMVLPFADSVKRAGIQKVISAIPGIGSGAEAILQVTVGTGVLVKNTIGGAAVIFLILLAAGPVAKLCFFLVLYQGAAALMEPVCDKRITACAEGMAKAHQLLLHLVIAVLLLFALSLGIICASTNAVYFGG